MRLYHGEFVFLALGIIKLVNGDNCLDIDSVVGHDRYMEHQVFRKVWSQSLYTCASECLMSSACLSLGFDKKTRTCLLNSNSSDSADVVDRTGFLFSDIQHWPKSLSGRCTEMTCSNNTRCEVTRLGLARCIPEFEGCGRPPDVRDANTMYDGHYQGAVATYSRYTCDPDYRACYNNVTSTCQSSGEWKSLAGLCGQFRWQNPEIREIHSLPCGPTSRFKLKISGRPTKPTRWSISTQKQEDLLLYTEFRLSFLGCSGIVVINTRIHGNWGSEERVNLPMAVGQYYDVEINFQDGEYKLVVDGTSIINFTERVSGAQPESVTVDYDVTVGTIEFLTK